MQTRIKRIGLTARLLLGAASTLMLCSSAFAMARDMENYPFYIPNFAYPVISISGGATFTSDVGRSQQLIDPVTGGTIQYNANRDSQTNAIFGGFAGSELFLRQDIHLQLGLGYHQPTAFEAKGIELPGGDAYNYSVRSHQLLIEGKLLYNCIGRFHPYLAGGFGVSFNDAFDYTTGPFSNTFDDHTNDSFSYVVGVGVDYDLAPQWRLGVGYRYSDFGRLDLGNGTFAGVRDSSTLKENHLFANEVLAEVSYIIY